MHNPHRIRCDIDALRNNYRYLRELSGTRCGAAVKADGYGLGASAVVQQLWDEGCRNFFVATWSEAAALHFLPPGCLSVLHGFGAHDEALPGVRPVLSTPEQIARWKARHAGQPCEVMVDTGMNRLGLALGELSLLEGLKVEIIHSHLVSADEDSDLNFRQLSQFEEVVQNTNAERYSLANSAGVFLGKAFAFDLVRPGIALYGGIPRAEAAGAIRPVASIEAEVIQRRSIRPGDSVGYNATFTANREMTLLAANIGYADGYPRSLSSQGQARYQGASLPVLGRVSMDLIVLDGSCAPEVREGDWIELDFDLPRLSEQTGLSQYELLTGLGPRGERVWA